MLRLGHCVLLACLCSAPAVDALAQERTIPETLASTTFDVGGLIRVEFGTLPTLDSIISASEVVVRGTAAVPRTFLSADQKLVYSDYEIVDVEVLDDPHGIFSDDTSPSLTFRQVGGTISMYGYDYSLTQENLPPLEPQHEYLFLLERLGDHFEASGLYFGVFEFGNNKLTSIGVNRFAEELKELTAEEAVTHILNRIKAVRR